MKNKISIIIPVYFNESTIAETVDRVVGVETPMAEKELILVDDGSGDNSWSVIQECQKRVTEAKVIGVKLIKNYGSMSAIAAGFEQTSGDCGILLTADLQDPPELIREMYDEWVNGYKTILAVRKDRVDSFFTKLCAKLYYILVKLFVFKDFPAGGFDYLLIDREVIDQINRLKEKNTNLLCLIYWLGYPTKMIKYARVLRKEGKSRWTFAKKVKLFIDTFIGFSYIPIRFMSFIGFIVAMIAFAFGVYQIALKILMDVPIQGYSTIITTILFLGGIQIFLFSILGEYIWRTLDEVRKRPKYIIEKLKTSEQKTF